LPGGVVREVAKVSRKLTRDEIEEIFELRIEGRSLAYCGERFNVTPECIRQAFMREFRQRQALRQKKSANEVRVDTIPMSTRVFRALMTLDVIYLGEIAKLTSVTC